MVDKINPIRIAAIIISVLATLWVLFCGMYAPFLLLIGVVWFGVSILLCFKERKIDSIGLAVAAIALGTLFGVYFIPLWIAERTAKEPNEYLRLAENFESRGQIMGNRAKVQAYYIKAAEGGNVIAQSRIGEAFYFGHYGVTNREKGVKWLKVAAANGHAPSQQLLQSLTH